MKYMNVKTMWLAAFALLATCMTSCTRNAGSVETSDTKIDHLIIKEVYFLGHETFKSRNWNGKTYEVSDPYTRDQYIIIKNPTEEVKYLDNLALVTSIDPAETAVFPTGQDFRNKYYGMKGMAIFPTTKENPGKSYPIQPGDSVIVAAYAINHADRFIKDQEKDGVTKEELPEGYDEFIDLSKADFEWTNPAFLNSDDQSYNNPNVPDMHPIMKYADGEAARPFPTELRESMSLALVEVPWTWEYFRDNNMPDPKNGKPGLTHEISVIEGEGMYVTEIPFDKVIDAVTICPKGSGIYKVVPCEKVDKGFQGITDDLIKNYRKYADRKKFRDLAIARRWDGRKFVDGNNSGHDFIVIHASLGIHKHEKANVESSGKKNDKKKNNKKKKK